MSDDPQQGAWAQRLSRYKETLIGIAATGAAVSVLNGINAQLSSRFLEQPRQAVWFLVPIAIAVWLLRQHLAGRRDFAIDRRLVVFLAVYVLLFSLAAQSRVLDWNRDLAVFDTTSRHAGLAPVSWGDWRYLLAPRVPATADDLVVVLLEPGAGKTVDESRKELADLVAIVAASDARGLALDVHFAGESGIDPLLCAVINGSGLPVYYGYGFARVEHRIAELPTPRSLQSCLAADRQGHLAGFRDTDGKVRLLPVFFRHDPTRPALSLQVARHLSGDRGLRLPRDGLLRFLEPASAHSPLRFADLQQRADLRNHLRNRFVLVGEDSRADRFDTPFGELPGVVIHAWAVESLRESHYVEMQPWWLSLAFILVFCYWLAVWCVNGASVLRLVALCAGATLCFVAVAAGSIRIGVVWFDVVYPALAVWLLLPLVVGLRRVVGRREA